MPTKLLLLTLSALALAGCGRAPMAIAQARPAAPAISAQDANRAKFFAGTETQAGAPGAFAVGADALPFLEAVERTAIPEREALVKAIRADARLHAAIRRFGTLTWEERLPVLKRVMALEARVMGFQAPPLVIGEGTSRVAFFDFDLSKPGSTGTVMLYPEALAREANPYAALLLLIHETRHSKQFQLAFAPEPTGDEQVLAAGYRAAFAAQKALAGRFSFCDFCTLHHEHEAFQTGNYVVGALTGWTVETADMGVLSSQFDERGRPRLDLLALARRVGPKRLLAAFNEREEPQFRLFFPSKP